MLILTKKSVPKIETGIPGLDELLRGGLPRGRVILLLGEPGAGKTILCSQFLLHGLKSAIVENGLFVSLEENWEHYSDEMATFDWDVASLKKCFMDVSRVRDQPSEIQIGDETIKNFKMVSLVEVIKNHVVDAGVRRIVIDPISHLIFQFTDIVQRRKVLLDLVEALSKTGATCLLSSELREVGGTKRRIQLEEYLVDGVIIMQSNPTGRTLRTIQVEKMRGSSIERSPKPYEIVENGIVVRTMDTVS